MTAYFVGPVIALLLRHLALTFASLSIVRDQQLGVMELFRVTPLSSCELLLGKLLSHMLLAVLIAMILTLVSLFALGVPLLGSPIDYSLAILAVTFASLTIGFTISLISESDSQAVQHSMIVLLASVFFSGFFLDLVSLIAPVRVISWALPATYGVEMLQSIMLRGQPPDALLMGGVSGLGALFMIVALLLARRRLAPS